MFHWTLLNKQKWSGQEEKSWALPKPRATVWSQPPTTPLTAGYCVVLYIFIFVSALVNECAGASAPSIPVRSSYFWGLMSPPSDQCGTCKCWVPLLAGFIFSPGSVNPSSFLLTCNGCCNSCESFAAWYSLALLDWICLWYQVLFSISSFPLQIVTPQCRWGFIVTPHETAMTSSSTQTRQQWISKRWLFVSTRTQLFQRRMNVARPNDPFKKRRRENIGKVWEIVHHSTARALRWLVIH